MSGILSSILAVFTSVGEWISTSVNNMIPMFYTAGTGSTGGELTFLGTLAVAGLAISVVFLVIRVITNFMQFRA